ncbi:alpha/beta hydrolase [Prauserella muralis]|uniref:Peptidase n=1 Tax=Prauserella muralis TaxID=588067 RepID=A0A2V4B1P0_9PSEU|nr:alpha/beta hydrolase [Prauserella muralis]PXY28200.1 peptidase [Prauserella muralis]TWE21984.1 alpha/beta hydrolase family protein [Prauserella muralis]
MPRRARRLTLAALVPLILAGCTAGPSTRPPVVENDGPAPSEKTTTPSQAPLPELAEPRGSAIDWSDCGAETQQRLGADGGEAGGSLSYSCARITTTLDAPDLPRRGIKRIAVLKAGTGPVPLVVVNDVDGEPGTLYAAKLAATLPPELLETFSLVGMDRRGTGQSDPARCIPSDVRATLLGHDPAAGLEPVLDAARTAGQQCAINLEDEQGALDSWRAAGDLDELRDQLGVARLNAIGHGEGSNVVALFGARYPGRAGRLVLDGVPDPSADRAAVLDGMAGGAEATLDAFGEQCATDPGCPLGGDVRGDVTALAEQARRSPVPTGRGTALGPGLVLRAVLAGLADRNRWGELAGALAAAKSGDGAKLSAFVEPMLVETEYAAARLDGSLATQCNDTVTRLPADQLAKAAKDLDARHPVFGAVLAQELAWCSPWPSRREPVPQLGAPGAPPILVISTAVDPVTPERGTIRAAERLPSAVRVAWQGTGHGALGSPCVAQATQAFLVNGTVPRDGTLCPA